MIGKYSIGDLVRSIHPIDFPGWKVEAGEIGTVIGQCSNEGRVQVAEEEPGEVFQEITEEEFKHST